MSQSPQAQESNPHDHSTCTYLHITLTKTAPRIYEWGLLIGSRLDGPVTIYSVRFDGVRSRWRPVSRSNILLRELKNLVCCVQLPPLPLVHEYTFRRWFETDWRDGVFSTDISLYRTDSPYQSWTICRSLSRPRVHLARLGSLNSLPRRSISSCGHALVSATLLIGGRIFTPISFKLAGWWNRDAVSFTGKVLMVEAL